MLQSPDGVGTFVILPDGARFAKINGQQEPSPDGLVHLGKLCAGRAYGEESSTLQKWEVCGRWRGMELKPYGKDEQFVHECTGCHRPPRRSDYV